MRQSRRPLRGLAIALVSSILPAALAEESRAAGGYTFKKIVDDQGEYDTFTVNSAKPLNDAGEVAFYATRPVGTPSSGMYRGNGTTIATIATYNTFFFDTGNTGSINNAGLVVFNGNLNAVQGGLYFGDGAAIYTVLYEGNSDPSPRRIMTGAATLNNADAVAFYGGRKNFPDQQPGTSKSGYYTVSSGSVTTIVEEGGAYQSAPGLPPAFNDAGKAAFMMSAGALNYHVLRYDNPGLTTIATGFSGSQLVSINDQGDVAFVNQNSSAVNVYRQGVVHTIASAADGFNVIPQGDAYVNNAGQVAFWGNVTTYNGNPVTWDGVFTGPDLTHDRVLLNGNALFGRTATSLELLGFNNAGQILMSARLSGPENIDVLFVATPPLAGDFQEDGDVDAEDLPFWTAGFGTTGNAYHGQGDADNDNDVDGDDFLIWQQQLGMTAPASTPAGAAVPEPAASVLFIVAAAAILVGCRRRAS